MFYLKSYIDNHTKEHGFQLRDKLIEKLNRVCKAKIGQRYDVVITLPSDHHVEIAMIISDHAWRDLYAPVKIIKANIPPHLIWFCQVENDEIVRINSIKHSAFKHIALDLFNPDKRIESHDMRVRIEPGDGGNPNVKPVLGEWSGFSLLTIKSYQLDFDLLLDSRTQFSFLEFDPALKTIDDGFWFMTHVGASYQDHKPFASYSPLWEQFQQYLTR